MQLTGNSGKPTQGLLGTTCVRYLPLRKLDWLDGISQRRPWEQYLRSDIEEFLSLSYIPTFLLGRTLKGRGRHSSNPHSRPLSQVRNGQNTKLAFKWKKGSFHLFSGTCSTEKGVLTTKTRLALKTKVDHKLIDLLELLLKSWKYTWERITLFPTDWAIMG